MLWLSHVNLNTDIAYHSHDAHEFIVCLEGEININTEHQSYHIGTGQAIFIPQGLSHSASVNKEEKNQFLFTCINSQELDSFTTPANSIYLKRLIQTISMTQTNSTEMLKIHKDNSPFLSCIKENLYLRLLLMHISEDMSLHNQDDAPAVIRITKAKCWIEQHYDEALNLEKVAQQVNMSRSHFARQFRQYTGFSMIDYLLKVRCDVIATQLAQSNTDISEIAFSAGFSNLSHFYRHFKRRYGTTPRAFRQMIRNQGAAMSA
jgi:AraC family L-rhamnose operon regulatory protein RhaS